MNFSTFRFTLDLHKHQSQMSIAVFKNDTAVRLCMSLTDGGNPYFIEDGCTAILYGVKPNGKPIIHSCAIENNTLIIYDFNRKTANLAGIVDCQLRLYKGGVPLRDENGDIVYEGGEPILDEEGNHKTDENGKFMYTEISILFREDHQIITAPRFIIVVNESLVQGDSDLDDESLTKNDFTAWEDVLLAEKLRQDAHNQREERIQALEATYDSKLTKIRDPNKIYGTAASENGDVEQVTYDISTAETPGVAFRTDGGQIELPEVTERQEPSATQAVPRSYVDKIVDGKLNKTNEIDVVYANGVFGAISLPWSEDVRGDAVVVRRPYGSVPVLLTPYNNDDATSKIYVDNKYNENSESIEDIKDRVELLESAELLYTEDNRKAYEKSVPNGVAPFATIKSIGGASITSKNLFNPNDCDYTDTAEGNTTINADGSFTITVNSGMPIIRSTTVLPKGDYYLNIISNEMPWAILYNDDGYDNTESISGAFSVTNDFNKLRLEFGPFSWSDEPVVINAKIMLTKGRVAESYEPYFAGFKNAEVERVESIGANIIPFPYEDKDKTQKGITYTVLADGGIKCVGTATGYGSYICSSNMHFEDGKTYYKSPEELQIAYKKADGSTGYANTPFTWKAEYTLVSVYVQISSGQTVDKIIYPMINVGSTKIPYAPYKAEPIDTFSIPVEAIKARVDGFGVGKNYIQWTDDKVEFMQMKKQAILNSKIAWGFYPNQTTSGAYVYYSNEFKKKIGYQTSRCSEFENVNGVWGFGTSGQYGDHSTTNNIYMCSNLATLDEWKAWLDKKETEGNPIILEYELATPIVTDITDLFTEDSVIEVEGGGSLRFVNENNLPVPSSVLYIKRKE